MRRLLAGGAAALLALAATGCGDHDRADLTGPAMALPRSTVAMLALDLHPNADGESAHARDLAAAVGYDSPLKLAGPVARELAEDLGERGAIFLLPAGDGAGLNSGVVAETRSPRAALDAARLIRPLVRAERKRRGGVVKAGTDAVHALARLRASPTAAAAVGRWVVWGDPRAVRAAVVAANGQSLGETVPFRRAVERFRSDGPGLLYIDPRPLTGAVVAGALGVNGAKGGALADALLGVRFARPVGGTATLGEHQVTIDTGAEDGCPATPLADAGGAPGDADFVAGLPLYGLAQQQCHPRTLNPLNLPLPGYESFDLERALGSLRFTRVAVQDGSLALAARIGDHAAATAQLPRLGRALDRFPGVRARVAGGDRLDVHAAGLPPVRLVLRPDRALLFIGRPPPPSVSPARQTPAFSSATRALGDRRLTALARRPARGVDYVAIGAEREGATVRGAGARIVVRFAPTPSR
jgi:hypothetical protein